jgi:hypothetical protein
LPKWENLLKKFIFGFVLGLATFAASQAIAACFKDGALVRGVNIFLIDTGELIHCPTASFMREGHHINCNR